MVRFLMPFYDQKAVCKKQPGFVAVMCNSFHIASRQPSIKFKIGRQHNLQCPGLLCLLQPLHVLYKYSVQGKRTKLPNNFCTAWPGILCTSLL
jgi:hypothetical protein